MNLKVIVTIFLLAAVPVYAQPQNPGTARGGKGDAQKVVTIISGDKAETKTYCELSEQIEEASAKKDGKTVNELSQKIETMEKTLGPEYLALIDGFEAIAKKDQLGNVATRSGETSDQATF